MSEKLTDLLKWYPDAISSLDKLMKDLRFAITEEAKKDCLQNDKAIIDSLTICQAAKKYIKPEFYDPYTNSGPRGD